MTGPSGENHPASLAGGTIAMPAGGSIAVTLRWTAIGSLLLLTLWLMSDVCLLVFAAALASVVLRRAADRVGALLHLPADWSLAMVLAALVLLMGTLVWWRGSATLDEMARLWGQLADQGRSVQHYIEHSPWGQGALGRLGSYLSDSGAIAGTWPGQPPRPWAASAACF